MKLATPRKRPGGATKAIKSAACIFGARPFLNMKINIDQNADHPAMTGHSTLIDGQQAHQGGTTSPSMFLAASVNKEGS